MTDFNPKASIVIPVYNGANYLREAIDSALAQTYQNCEVLVINDGSTDNGATRDIALSYGERIRYFEKENGGVATALNLGIREMKGEYFSWLSHDDLFSNDRIYEDIKVIKEHHNARITYCRIAYINSSGRLISEHSYYLNNVSNLKDAICTDAHNMCALTIHKQCFEKVGVFDESNKTTQDMMMILLLAKRFTFYANNNSIIYTREHKQRGTHKLKKQHSRDMLFLSDFIKNNFSIDDFFPCINNKDKIQQAKAWAWMGDLYCYHGSHENADMCYREGYAKDSRILTDVGIKYLIGARLLSWVLFRRLIQLKKYFFK